MSLPLLCIMKNLSIYKPKKKKKQAELSLKTEFLGNHFTCKTECKEQGKIKQQEFEHYVIVSFQDSNTRQPRKETNKLTQKSLTSQSFKVLMADGQCSYLHFFLLLYTHFK